MPAESGGRHAPDDQENGRRAGSGRAVQRRAPCLSGDSLLSRLRPPAPLLAPVETARRAPGIEMLGARLACYGRLDPRLRVAVDQLAARRVRRVSAKRDILRESEHPHSLIAVRRGWACRYKTLPGGQRQLLAILLPGDLVDLHAQVLACTDHSVAAITNVEVSLIDPHELDTLVRQHPPLGDRLARQALAQQAVEREWLLSIGQRSAHEKIAQLLLEIYVRLRLVGLADAHGCDMPLTQFDMAEAAGLTAVHVNRTLQALRRDGLIVLERRRLTLPDPDRLANAAMFNPVSLHLDPDVLAAVAIPSGHRSPIWSVTDFG